MFDIIHVWFIPKTVIDYNTFIPDCDDRVSGQEHAFIDWLVLEDEAAVATSADHHRLRSDACESERIISRHIAVEIHLAPFHYVGKAIPINVGKIGSP